MHADSNAKTAVQHIKSASMPIPQSGVIVFLVNEVCCCVELEYVARVMPLCAIDPVPMGASYLRGLLSIGGGEVPVIDLAERLCLDDRRPYDLGTPILLCSDGNRQIGLIVSTVLGLAVSDISAPQLPAMPPSFAGALVTEHGRALRLDVEWLLAVDLSLPGAPFARTLPEGMS